MTPLSIAQVLSGYEQGHGVLATGGDVSDAERALVDRLSDLSGYLPLDTTFSSYWTGYPCGRYHAFACTWPDLQAARSGTVLTHTLLVPRDALADIHDLATLASAFRLPQSPADRAAYRAPITMDAAMGEPPPPAQERALAIAALWFGQPERPVFWMDDADAGDVVRALWRLLWPEARAAFTFCTFALGVRKVNGVPFDFLALPPAARASFLEWTRSPAWFDRGKLLDPGVRRFAAERWTADLLERGAALFEPVFTLCREHALPVPPTWQLRDALRFLRLQTAAADPLNAARTRVDLLFWLWRALPAAHPLARSVLDALLAVLPEAPVDRRPLRELKDFVSRGAVNELAAEDPAFVDRVGRVLEREIARRLRESAEAEGELLELLQGCDRPAWRAAILRAAVPAAAATRTALSAELLTIAAQEDKPPWISDALSPLPAEQRPDAVRRATAKLDAERARRLWTNVDAAATALRDLDLLLAAGEALGDRAAGLGRVIALARETGADVKALLKKIPAGEVLTWALRSSDETSWAERIGEDAARALDLGPEALAARCEDALPAASADPPVAARIFVRVTTSATSDAVKKALRGHALLAEQIVRLAVREGGTASLHLRDALAALPEAEPCTEAILIELERPGRSAWARDVAERLTPWLVESLRRTTLSPALGARWLALADIRAYVRRARSWELFARCPEPARGNGLAALADAAQRSLGLRPDTSAEWVARWILPALEAASAEDLAVASEPVSALLRAPLDQETRFSLAMASFEAVKAKRAKGGRAIVESAFPIIYPALLSDRRKPLLWFIQSLIWAKDWDHAKPARRWLLDAWMAWGWPPAGFLRALGEDRGLFKRMVARMARSEEGLAFLRALGEATRADPDLSAVWGPDVERALADPHSPVDYE